MANLRFLITFLILSLINSYSFGQWTPWSSYTNGHQVVDVAEDAQILWIATSGGLVRIDQQTNDTLFLTRSNADFSRYNITCIEVDNLHQLWVGTDDDGIYLFDGSNWTHNPSGLILPTQIIGDIKKDSLGNIYVGCLFYLTVDQMGFPIPHPGGLYKYNGNSWTNLTPNLGHFEKNVTQIDFDHTGRMVVFDNSLNIFNGTLWIHSNITGNNPKINRFAIDSLNQIITLPDSVTKAVYNGVNWTYSPLNTTLHNWHYYSPHKIIVDPNENLWISCSNPGFNGLYKFNGATWTIYDTSNSPLLSNQITGLNFINDKLFIGSINKELQTLDSFYTWTFIPTSNSKLYNNSLAAVYVDQNNMVYTTSRDPATGQYLLVSFDGQIWNVLATFNYIYYASIRFIHIDSQGNFWLGGSSGLLKYDGQTWQQFDMSNTTFLNNGVNSITEDASGHIWIASGPGYIAEYDGLNWTTYIMPGMTGGFGSIIVDPSGNKWMSSNYGLHKFDNAGQWQTFANFNGPVASDNRVFSLVSDTLNGRILLTTPLGIVAYDFNNFTPLNPIKHTFLSLDHNGNIWAGKANLTSSYTLEINVLNSNGQLITTHTNGSEGFIAIVTQGPKFTSDGKAYIACGYNGLLRYDYVNSVGLENNETENSSDFSIYPNPSNGLFEIKGNNIINDKYFISVYDLSGKFIKESSLYLKNQSGIFNIDLSEFNDGIYFINIKSHTKTHHYKVVKTGITK